jgi:GTP-binding protein HflX
VDTGKDTAWPSQTSMEELAKLVKSAGAQVVGQTTQKLPSPSPTHYLGKGKLEELAALKESSGYNAIIFDDELSPDQQKNLEFALGVKVIDRVALIVDIFARRAQTREGKLQVALAQYQYLLPRLSGQWRHLERLGGGIGTRGPGESQLETDKRLVQQKITRLKSEIEAVRKQRALYRERRRKRGLPIIALVGYTNSGKSTLINALCGANVYVENKPFATLDPTTRRLFLSQSGNVLLSDTVGFIHKLPPILVAAFRATLEELEEADLLLHVVDLSLHNAPEQCQVVENILGDLNLSHKPRLTVLNKIDLILDRRQSWDEALALKFLSENGTSENGNTVMVSAAQKWGLNRLRRLIDQQLIDNIPAYRVQGTDAL